MPDWAYTLFIIVLVIAYLTALALQRRTFKRRLTASDDRSRHAENTLRELRYTDAERAREQDRLIEKMRISGRRARATIRSLSERYQAAKRRIERLQATVEELGRQLRTARKANDLLTEQRDAARKAAGEERSARSRENDALRGQLNWLQRHVGATRVRTVIETPGRHTSKGWVERTSEVIYEGDDFDRAEAFRVRFLTEATKLQIKRGAYAVVEVTVEPLWQARNPGADERRGGPEVKPASYVSIGTLPETMCPVDRFSQVRFSDPVAVNMIETDRAAAAMADICALPRTIYVGTGV